MKVKGEAAMAAKKMTFAERFREAYRKSMVEEAAEVEKMPEVFEKGEGLEEVVDTEEKHF